MTIRHAILASLWLAVATSASAQVQVQILHTLTPAEGASVNGLIQGGDGALYGTALNGGPANRGTVFRVTPDGTFTVVHSFDSDGANPVGLAQGLDGNFYVSMRHGVSGVGNQLLSEILLRVTPSGDVSFLFSSPRPLNALAAARDGLLYGLGQSGNDGVLYRMTTSLPATTHTFSNGLDLYYTFQVPRPLVEGPDQSLYGTTTGFYSASTPFKVPGTVFRLSPDRTSFTTLHTFDPAFSVPGPIAIGTDGNLYGFNANQFYRISAPEGGAPVYTTLASFPSSFGTGSLIQAAAGYFYTAGVGGIYRITTAGVTSRACAFPSSAVATSMVAGADGNVYGTVVDNGTSSIFRCATPEVMTLDAPGDQTTVAQPFYAGGWAIDSAATSGPGVDAVHLWAFPANGDAAVFLGAAEYFRPRADVGSIYGAGFTDSGYRLAVSGLAPGTYTFVAYARSSLTGAFSQSRASVVTVTNAVSQPAMNIDIPGPGATVPGSFQVAGWAIDRTALDDAGVDAIHVYAMAAGGSVTFLGVANYGQPRTDVGTAYGAQFVNSGFSLAASAPLAPGPYTLVVYARSTVSGAFFSQSRSITVRAPGDPLMAIDAPSNGATAGQPFVLGGWAIDRDAVTGPGVDAVHVWAYPLGGGSPIFVGTGQLDFARGDIGAMFGAQFTNAGYNVTVSGLPPGQYQIAVYAHSTVTGTFNQSRVVTVAVPSP